eukprot:9010159-Alexandrium_andersonii.AAC.1
MAASSRSWLRMASTAGGRSRATSTPTGPDLTERSSRAAPAAVASRGHGLAKAKVTPAPLAL